MVIGQVDADVWRLIGCGRDEGFEEQVRGTLGNIPDGSETRSSFMSQLGQSLPKCDVRATSALPPIATKERTSWHVSKVPCADACTANKDLLDHLHRRV